LHRENQAWQGDEDHGNGADGTGLPVALCIESASPHEITLVDRLLERRFLKELPERLIGDMAYDSDPLDARLARRGIQMISPHRSNRCSPRTQDKRTLRRYKRRWKVERLFAWLQNFRRVLVRFEYYAENYLGFVLLGCIVICCGTYYEMTSSDFQDCRIQPLCHFPKPAKCLSLWVLLANGLPHRAGRKPFAHAL